MFRNNRIKSIDIIKSFDGTPVKGRILYEDGVELYYPIDPDNGLVMTEVFLPGAKSVRNFKGTDNEFLVYTYNQIHRDDKYKDSNVVPACIKLPLNGEELHKKVSSYDEYLEIRDENPHVNIWFMPNPIHSYNHNSITTIDMLWVELPKEIEGVKYVPIIIHSGDAISVHPYFHKYFLRSFDKKTRHLILGFCYVNGPSIISKCYYSAGKKEINPIDIRNMDIRAFLYKDSDAPKRINMGPSKYTSEEEIKNFEEWLEKTRDAFGL